MRKEAVSSATPDEDLESIANLTIHTHESRRKVEASSQTMDKFYFSVR